MKFLFDRSQHISRKTNKMDDLTNNSNSIKDSNFFPRCEYKSRFEGTSIFEMSEPEFWGRYFRTTVQGVECDRIAKLMGCKKTYENKNIHKPLSSSVKAGTIYSPWQFDTYKDIFYENPPTTSDKKNPFLYDSLLEYKNNICQMVVDFFEQPQIMNHENLLLNVYVRNDYPCILVQIKELNVENEQRSMYKMFGAYFTAITNYIAKREQIPIELVNRSSFGHNSPSIAETGNIFRINIGLVPKIYAEKVLVPSFIYFNDNFLLPLLKKQNGDRFKLGLTEEQVTGYNENVDLYMKDEYKDKAKWYLDDNLFDVLCKLGDSRGHKVSYQIARKKQYIDLITDYVYTEMGNELPDFAQPLREMLTKLDYFYDEINNEYQPTLKIKEEEYRTSIIKFAEREDKDIKNDDDFWKIIKSILKAISTKAINTKKIKGLHGLLEEENLEFIRNSNNQNCDDGYGSDSDCEGSINSTKFYSKKITVGTGMRAINLAQFLSIYLTGSKQSDTKYMYFETCLSIVQIKDIRKELNSNRSEVKYIDLSHCAADGPNSIVNLRNIRDNLHEDEKVIVFDYTSTETMKINEAVRLFIPKVPVLLLVNSGLKNEQIGADMNPYGTLRIIARDDEVLNELYFGLKGTLASEKEEWPKQLHNIRKAYKDAGAVVTNKAIYDEKYRQHDGDYYHANVKDNFEFGNTGCPDELKKIFDLFFDGKCGNLPLTEDSKNGFLECC